MTVSTMGMTKHRISGKSVNNNHFTGKKKSKSKRKQALTKKEKNRRRHTHVNKYKVEL
jgi:hypothetical protein